VAAEPTKGAARGTVVFGGVVEMPYSEGKVPYTAARLGSSAASPPAASPPPPATPVGGATPAGRAAGSASPDAAAGENGDDDGDGPARGPGAMPGRRSESFQAREAAAQRSATLRREMQETTDRLANLDAEVRERRVIL
jgi:hypothetical protein